MRQSTRVGVAAAAVLGLVSTSLLWQAQPATAAAGCLTSSADFDSDGTPDIAVGSPGGSGRNGAVQVTLSNKGKPLTETIPGAPGFGTAVTSLSSYQKPGDEALCSQLVVGSPDESLSTDKQRSGVVYVYSWDRSARRFVMRGTFYSQAQGVEGADQSGARFGAALAAEQRPAGQAQARPTRLYVGAPGFDGDVPNSGLVTSFWIDDDEDPRAHSTRMMGLGEPVSDMPVEGAALGSSLSVAGGLVAMGVPGMVGGGGARDGAVLVDLDQVDIDPDRPLSILSQATPGVPGKPETNDRFGAAVHLVASPHGGAPTLLIGAPGEDLGRIRNAGTVTVARISPTTLELSGVRTVSQDSSGMAGRAEAGDAFGSSVSSMRNGSAINYLVGVPGEDVGRVRDAGMVQTIGTGKGWTQRSKGVPGISEAGDRMGASLAGGAATGTRRPLIGIPGEDASAGAVEVGLPIGGASVGYLKGHRAGDRYGFSVGP